VWAWGVVLSGAGGSARAGVTRGQFLAAAERLFAGRGANVVSNRQVSDAAGQSNNAAVLYHFGTKTYLVRGIAGTHAAEVGQHRERLVASAGDSTEYPGWMACLVRPLTDHLATLAVLPGTPAAAPR